MIFLGVPYIVFSNEGFIFTSAYYANLNDNIRPCDLVSFMPYLTKFDRKNTTYRNLPTIIIGLHTLIPLIRF